MTYKCCFGQYFWRCTKKDIDLKKWLHAVWYCKKCVSAQYDTARNVTSHSMILQGMWLCAVWYCKECDSAQHDTARNVTPRSMILCEAWLCAVSYRVEIRQFEYLRENDTKKATILTHWSVAQASSNDEKNGESKILLECPFKLLLQRG